MHKEEDRRTRIMNVAATHFLRDGFVRTSMDRIAAAARVSKQVIYQLWRDKADLFDQVVRAEMGAGLDQELRPKGSVRETLEAAAANVIDSFATPRNYGLFRANIAATRQFPELAAALHEYRRGASPALTAYLTQLKSEGAIGLPAGDGVDLSTRLGGMAVEGMRYFLGYDLPERGRRSRLARNAVEMFLNGIGRMAGEPGADEDARQLSMPVPPERETASQIRLKPEKFAALCGLAVDEFLEHGFEAASIDRIMAATGVGRSTIYRQFGSKEGLFRYVIGQEVAQQAALELEVPKGGDFEAKLRKLNRAALDLHLSPRNIRLHHLLVQQSAVFPELARNLYDVQVLRIARPLLSLTDAEAMPVPSLFAVRACHTLAIFGVRYVANLRAVDEKERDRVSRQAAFIMAHGVKTKV